LIDGDRESTESWVDLLRDCRRRGMRAPVLATGHGALGFWAVLREAFPQTRQQSPKAPARIADDLDVLLEFYDYQAEQWVHLGITNPIESTFLPSSGTTGARSPRAPIPARPAWRWHSSSSRPPSPGDRP